MNKIKKIAKKRKIPFLLHFTKLSNIDSIMKYGLVSRVKIEDKGIEASINDELRLDNHEDAVSVSIAFPNYKMFYKLRQETDDSWAIVVIFPKVIWKRDIAFCKHNAADRRISSLDLDSLMTPKAFKGMFKAIDTERSRKDQKLKSFDPTDSQAELLVFDRIKPKDIAGVVFSKKRDKVLFKKKHPNKKAWFHKEGKGMYATRTYLREYN